MDSIIQFVLDRFYYIFLGLLGAYVLIRLKYKHSSQKRQIFFKLAIGVFLIFTASITIVEGFLPMGFFFPVCALVILGEVYFVRRAWKFRMDCVECGKRMDWTTIITDDRNLCTDCLDAAEAAVEVSEATGATEAAEVVDDAEAESSDI